MIESYSDGAGKNASGKGAASFIIVKDQSIMHQESVLLRDKTNNEAEYIALYNAIDWIVKEGYDYAICNVDSELVFKQLTNQYKINVPELKNWVYKIGSLRFGTGVKVEYQWVPRENVYIKQADKLNKRIMRLP